MSEQELTEATAASSINEKVAKWQQEVAERRQKLEYDANWAHRVMMAWHNVESQEDWQKVIDETYEELKTSSFLLKQIGAERHLEPSLMAALMILRRTLIDDQGAQTAAEIMIIDMAILSYYNALRLQGIVGNLVLHTESEFFGWAGPHAKFEKLYGRGSSRLQPTGLQVADLIGKLGQDLLPLLDRCNRMLLRNLKALHERKQPSQPNVTIGQAGQVNVGGQQVNLSQPTQSSGADDVQ